MRIKERIEADLKAAMLAGDKDKTTTLRGLKSSILNSEIEQNKRESGLNDEEVLALLSKEVKKRRESIELYNQGGSAERAEAETKESKIIQAYLPEQLNEDEVSKIIDEVMATMPGADKSQLGKIIGDARARTKGQADGALIARLVKEKLS